MELKFKNQGKFEYKIPTMKFLNYSIEELNKQHLVILLPLYLLKLKKEIEKEQSTENAIKLKTLINDGIIKSIEDNEKAGNITYDDTIVLIGLLKKLYTHLYGNIKKFKEVGVNEMIIEKLILDSDKIIYKYEKREKQLISEVEKREEKAKLETAEEMILNNEPLGKIIKYSKLSEKKIRQLAKKLSKEIVLQ